MIKWHAIQFETVDVSDWFLIHRSGVCVIIRIWIIRLKSNQRKENRFLFKAASLRATATTSLYSNACIHMLSICYIKCLSKKETETDLYMFGKYCDKYSTLDRTIWIENNNERLHDTLHRWYGDGDESPLKLK